MKLACASGALHSSFARGDLTQLEFLDLCAHDLACDGVVLDVRHFPRTDEDYLAQLKKMAADRGLTVAAVAAPEFFGSAQSAMAEVIKDAVAIGAPLISAELVAEIASPWTEQLERLNVATSLAKAANVTLAVRNAPGTFAATTHDCKRVVKEADSAWLRFGPEPRNFGAGSDPAELAANSVLLWCNVGNQSERSAGDLIRDFPAFRGHVALDEPSGDATVTDLRAAVRSWRIALAAVELNRT
ncbi:MAG: TIM barrel protein [Candidatus Tumulicola sp.]